MSNKFIKPTVGRVVLYHPALGMEQPFAATVSYVHSDRMVNIGYLDADGVHHSATSVPLMQPGDSASVGYFPHCHWMEYQIDQAAKTEQLQERVDTLTSGETSGPASGAVGDTDQAGDIGADPVAAVESTEEANSTVAE